MLHNISIPIPPSRRLESAGLAGRKEAAAAGEVRILQFEGGRECLCGGGGNLLGRWLLRICASVCHKSALLYTHTLSLSRTHARTHTHTHTHTHKRDRGGTLNNGGAAKQRRAVSLCGHSRAQRGGGGRSKGWSGRGQRCGGRAGYGGSGGRGGGPGCFAGCAMG